MGDRRDKWLLTGEIDDVGGAVRWLRDRKVPVRAVASLLTRTESDVAVIDWRERRRERKAPRLVLNSVDRAASLADQLLLGTNTGLPYEIHDLTALESPSRARRQLEEDVDRFGSSFWNRVRYLRGDRELGLLLRRLSRPGSDNAALLRLAARISLLRCEVHVHAGYSRSALAYGAAAYRGFEQVYRMTLWREDLNFLGKTGLLISRAFIMRNEYEPARQWLNRNLQAFQAARTMIDPELFHQLAILQFVEGYADHALENLARGAQLLPEYNRRATTAAIRDIGNRSQNLLSDPVNWDGSNGALELLDYALQNWPPGDIHLAINVNWTAACGLSIDDPAANIAAIELLSKYDNFSSGYGHPRTVSRLLRLAPRLPKNLRRDWARFAIRYNAFRNY